MCRQPRAVAFFEVADRAMVTCIDHKQIMGFTDRQVSQWKDETLKMLSFSLDSVLYSPLKFLENICIVDGRNVWDYGPTFTAAWAPARILPSPFLLKARYRRGPTKDKQIWTNLKNCGLFLSVILEQVRLNKRAKSRWEISTKQKADGQANLERTNNCQRLTVICVMSLVSVKEQTDSWAGHVHLAINGVFFVSCAKSDILVETKAWI